MVSIFMLMLSGFAFGQNSGMTREEALTGATKMIIGIKNSTVSIFNESSNYEEFRAKLIGRKGKCETVEGENLLKKIYDIHYQKLNDDKIFETKIGFNELGYALKKSTSLKDNGESLFNSDTNSLSRAEEGGCGCRWFQVGCWFDCVFGPKAGPKLLDALIDILINLIKSI